MKGLILYDSPDSPDNIINLVSTVRSLGQQFDSMNRTDLSLDQVTKIIIFILVI